MQRIFWMLLITGFCISEVSAQIFVNFQDNGSFVTPEFSELGLNASSTTGVGLTGGGIGVAGGVSDGLVEPGEKIEVQLPFAVTNFRMTSLPITGNFDFEFEAFENGISIGTVDYNFALDGVMEFTSIFGQPFDSFSMTGIGGPIGGENIAYLAFTPRTLNNAGMEDGTPGQSGAPGWESVNDVFTVSANAQSGSSSVQLVAPTGQDFVSSQLIQDFPGVAEGMFVQASAFALHSNIDPITGENIGRVVLDFLDQDGNPIDVNPSKMETGIISQAINATTKRDEFVFLNTGYFEAPAGTQSARITLSHIQFPMPNNEGTGSIFFDEAALNLTSESIVRTFATFGEDFQFTDEQLLVNEPPLVYEIIHDGIGQIRIDTLGSDDHTEIALYDFNGLPVDSATGSPPDGTPGIQQAQLFYTDLPPGRYVLMAGRNIASLESNIFFDTDTQTLVNANMVVSVSSNSLAPTTPPQTIGKFNPNGFGYLESEVIQLDLNDPFFYEITFDGLSTLTFSATEITPDTGPSASLGFYDVFGNLIAMGLDELSFDSLEAGTYYFGITNPSNEFFHNFDWELISFFTDPVNVKVTTSALGDINCDGNIDLLDVVPFVDIIIGGFYVAKADLNQDLAVDLIDVDLFVQLLLGQ